MTFRGSNIGIITTIIFIVLGLVTFISTGNLIVIAVVVGWFAMYSTTAWVKQVEINDRDIIIKRLWGVKRVVPLSAITGVEFSKRSLIIYRSAYNGIGIFYNQIDKQDREKLKDFLKPYKL